MQHLSAEMRACVEECQRCHGACLGMAMNHCLEAGGEHVAPDHLRLMLACAEMCQASANMMLIGTRHHRRTCAEICEECVRSCERIGGMKDCAAQCRRRAASCRKMAA